jgi:hypothetical protein
LVKAEVRRPSPGFNESGTSHPEKRFHWSSAQAVPTKGVRNVALSSWLYRPSRPRKKHRKIKESSQKVRLHLEALEDRTAPATGSVVSVPQLFVADVYFTELAQSAAAAKIAQYSGELLPGFTATDVANQILSTPDFQAVEIRQLYARFAGFDPGSGGVSFWLDLLTRPGNTMDTVRVDFLSSDIYFNRVGGTNTAFVSALFGDVWNKPIDPALLNQYVSALNNGATRNSVATAFVTDPKGYQAQIIADYDKVLDHDPSAANISFFISFRQNGGTNEQILAQLHGSSELLKHLQFFQSHTVLTDADIAAATFRANLRAQIGAQAQAQATAQAAAAQAQQDAANAATDESDAAMDIDRAKAAFNDPTTANAAASDAQSKANDASGQDSDAKSQVIIAQTALASAEPTPETVQAVADAQTAETAAAASAAQAQKDAAAAKTAAQAAKSANLDDFLNGLVTSANGAAQDADSAKTSADHLVDGFAGPPKVVGASKDAADALSDAQAAITAVNSANGGNPYPDGSQAAQLIDAARSAAQGAQGFANATSGFAHDADTDRNTIGMKAQGAHDAANQTATAVTAALDAFHQLQNLNFITDFFQFFTLLDQFFTNFDLAVSENAMALQDASDAQGLLNNPQSDPNFVRNVQSDANKAVGQLGLTQQAQTQALNDIAAAKAANDAANQGGTGTGDDHNGDDNGGKRPGGGRG